MPDEPTPSTPAAPATVAIPGLAPTPGPSTTINYNLPSGAPPPVAPTAPAAAAPPGSTPPAVIPLTNEQFQEFVNDRARLRQMELDQQARQRAADQAEVDHKMKLGQAEAALQLAREQAQKEADDLKIRHTQTESRAKRYALEGELARALGSQPLVPGGAEQLTQLWRDQFSVQVEGDTFAVRTASMQSVGTFVAERLALPEYAHFVRANNPGGGAGTNQSAAQTVPTPAQNQMPESDANLNMGQAAIKFAMENKAKQGDPRLDANAGFGFRRLG